MYIYFLSSGGFPAGVPPGCVLRRGRQGAVADCVRLRQGRGRHPRSHVQLLPRLVSIHVCTDRRQQLVPCCYLASAACVSQTAVVVLYLRSIVWCAHRRLLWRQV